MSSIMSTMCVCGQIQIMDLLGAHNLFVEHDDPRTGQRCPGVPQPEYRAVRAIHSKECKIRDYPTCTDDCYNRQTELNPGLPREHS